MQFDFLNRFSRKVLERAREVPRQAARRRFVRGSTLFHPKFEWLESRNLLTGVIVNVITDTDAANPTTSPNDSTGHVSLRSAMEYANDHAGTAITFDSTVFATAQTITLGSSLPDISASMTITGPSSTDSGRVVISGGGSVRDFYMLVGTVSISNVTIANGFASASDPHGTQGAGFFEDFDGVDLNAVSFTNCTFSGNATANIAGGEGGAIWAAGGLTVTNCTFSSNTAATSAGLAGAIFWGGSETPTTPLAISGSTFVNNSADEGGAIYFGGSNSATLTNSTFTQNSASAFGGAIEATSSFTMVNCTLTNNSAGARSGGIDLFTSGVVLTNTIVSGNTSGSTADISGESNGGDLVLANANNNLLGQIGSGSTVTNGSNGNIVGVTNPHLLTLGNYGGLTQTMPPGPGSAAINAGTSSGAPSTDQQGNSRPLPVGTNVDIGAVEISQIPDLTISKSHTGSFTEGDTADTYTITVTNSGTGTTSGTVTVSDTLPSGLSVANKSGTGWSFTVAGSTVTATRSDALASTASYAPITVTVSVAGNAAASVTNTATVAGGGETATGNDTATDATTITQVADLTLVKSHTGTFSEGDTGDTYTLTVTNSGGGVTSGTVTVTDTLPTGETPTAASGGGWSTTIVGSTVTATRSDALAGSGSYPALTVTVSVADNAGATITNTASVAGGSEVNTSNDTATDPTTVIQKADLTITRSHTPGFNEGDTADKYTITVSNSGNASTSGTVTVTDTLPAGLTPTAAAGTGWTTTIVGSTVTATRSDALANGGSYPALSVTVSVASNAAASVTNTATVAGGGEVNTANDTTTDETAIGQLPDLTIVKSHSGTFNPNDTADQYTITVTNSGGATTSAIVTVKDTLPSGLTPTAAAGSGWSTTIAGSTVTATRSDSLSGGSSYQPLTVTVSVAPSATSTTNTATVAGGGETNTANDTATDPTTISTNSAPVLNGSATFKLADINTNPNSGTAITAIIASGGSNAITDANPGALEGIAVTADANSLGQWQYSLNNGGSWANVPAVSGTSALLLAADANTRLRVNAPLTSFGTSSITFRAWDQSSGTNGGTADVSTNGGTTAFSTATATATELVSPYVVSGSTLTVNGTPSNDQFSITGGAATFEVDMDGVSQGYSTATITSVIYNGNGGSDTTTIVSLQGTATASFSPTQTTVTGSGYSYQINASQTVYVFGAAGDTATMNDSAGDDLFYGLPAYSVMENAPSNGSTYWNEAIGFGTVNAVASTGTDLAYLYDSSGNDTFTSDSTGSQMVGSGYKVHAAAFDAAYGFFFNGGTDTANIGPNTTTKNFVYGTSSDTANLSDSTGADQFTAVPQSHYSVLQGSGYFNEAITFGNVQATSSHGGSDVASFYDTSGSDTFTATGNSSTLVSGALTNTTIGFASNYAFLASGTDTANLHAGTVRNNYVYGTSSDTVNFFDSSGNDVFYGLPAYSYMNYNGGSYIGQAIGFGHVTATASTGTDQAYLYDSPGNDSIVVGGTTATLNLASPVVTIQVNNFGSVFATRNQGGSDTEHVTAHDFFYESLGGWTDV